MEGTQTPEGSLRGLPSLPGDDGRLSRRGVSVPRHGGPGEEVGKAEQSEGLAEQIPEAGQSLTLEENGHPQGIRIQENTEDTMIIRATFIEHLLCAEPQDGLYEYFYLILT